MSDVRTATLVMDEVPMSQVEQVSGPLEILSLGPLRARMIGGLFAKAGQVAACPTVVGELAMTPFRVDGGVYMQVQLDISHSHDGTRVSGSFALSLADAEQLLERMKAPVELARLESAQ